MSQEPQSALDRERSIFMEALKFTAPAERAAFLDRACAGQASLRAAVETLLQNHANDSFMGKTGRTKRLVPITERPGDMIDRYKLMERIGEGGFGEVYVAEQREPVRRWVALKISKLGMDTRQVVARFEAERQALAMMDHPNIAKVLDGGATESGRPYFVMELVRGVKITEYCDQNKLSTRQRLDLFIQVCRAVQHAHQKGVIHRDIKPSNILVTLHDGVPVPKVIDFGIAKATQGHLTDKTIYTEFQQFMGTPAYMSPEQAEMSGLDIDTRADLYSLGVLLYELLTGSPPFDSAKLLEAGIDEMRRTIREVEPPRPSTRLSSLTNDELTTAARRHGTEAPKLVTLVRGDLDWIVMKCLEKDRSRRYESASGLAADIERHLNNEPIVARPPSQWYRLQKTALRHKFAVGASGAVCLALLAGFLVSTAFYAREAKARGRASLAADHAEKVVRDLVALADNAARTKKIDRDRAGDEPDADGVRKTKPLTLALVDTATDNYEKYLGQNRQSADVKANLAQLYQDKAKIYWQQAERDAELSGRWNDPSEMRRKENFQKAILAEREAATNSLEKSLGLFSELADEFPKTMTYQDGLAAYYVLRADSLDNPREAAGLLRKALNIRADLLREHPEDWNQKEGLADVLQQLSQSETDQEEARVWTRREMELREQIAARPGLAPEEMSNACVRLADVYGRAADAVTDRAAAIDILTRAIRQIESHKAIFLVSGGPTNLHPVDLENVALLASFRAKLTQRQMESGNLAEAVRAAQGNSDAASLVVANGGGAEESMIAAKIQLADTQAASGQTAESLVNYGEAISMMQTRCRRGRLGSVWESDSSGVLHLVPGVDLGVELDRLWNKVLEHWIVNSNFSEAVATESGAEVFWQHLYGDSPREWEDLVAASDLCLSSLLPAAHRHDDLAERRRRMAACESDMAEYKPELLVSLARILAGRASNTNASSPFLKSLHARYADQAMAYLRLAAAQTNYNYPQNELQAKEFDLLRKRPDFAVLEQGWSVRYGSLLDVFRGAVQVEDLATIKRAAMSKGIITLRGVIEAAQWAPNRRYLYITFAGVPGHEFKAVIRQANQIELMAKFGGELTNALKKGGVLEIVGQPTYYYSELQMELLTPGQILNYKPPAAESPAKAESTRELAASGMSAPAAAQGSASGILPVADTDRLTAAFRQDVVVAGTVYAVEHLTAGSVRIVFEESPPGGFVGFCRRENAESFGGALDNLRGKHISLRGRMDSYYGQPEIIITNLAQLVVDQPAK